MRATAPVLLLVLSACGADAVYTPFDAAAVEAARAELAVQGELDELGETVTLETAATVFASAQALYEAELQDAVAARTDAHLDAGWGFEDAGTTLDREVGYALETGAAATDLNEALRGAEGSNKLLHVSFYHAVYGGLASRTRAGLDAAWGFVGFADDGAPSAGLAAVAAGREEEYGVDLLPGTADAFVDAKAALEAGTTGDEALGEDADFDAAVEAIDLALIHTLGLYATHELAEVGDPDEGDVKLAEARAVWEGVAPYAAHVDSTVADTILAALYPDGGPVRSTSGYVLSGLDAVQAGDTIIDAAGATSAIQSILPE